MEYKFIYTSQRTLAISNLNDACILNISGNFTGATAFSLFLPSNVIS